jgi:hypothetical protein
MNDHDDIAERLARERPRPRAAFVEALADRLGEPEGPGRGRAAALIVAYGASGALLLAIAALGAAGGGPLAP